MSRRRRLTTRSAPHEGFFFVFEQERALLQVTRSKIIATCVQARTDDFADLIFRVCVEDIFSGTFKRKEICFAIRHETETRRDD